MGLLNRDQILAAEDLKRETVSVPEWGGEVLVSAVTGDARDELETHMFASGKSAEQRMKSFRARIAALCIVDETGNLLFTEADIEKLGRKSAKALQRVVRVAERLNGFSAAEVDDITKNSEPSPRDASTSS